MAQEDRPSWAQWYEALRQQVPVVRQRLGEWAGEVREEPVLLWETPAVRYMVYGVGAIVLLWTMSAVPGMLAPAPPPSARPVATTADFHVVCKDPQCGHHFVIHRKFGFNKFPVECPRCGKQTGMEARRCNSKNCRGRWVAPTEKDGRLYCPRCGRHFN